MVSENISDLLRGKPRLKRLLIMNCLKPTSSHLALRCNVLSVLSFSFISSGGRCRGCWQPFCSLHLHLEMWENPYTSGPITSKKTVPGIFVARGTHVFVRLSTVTSVWRVSLQSRIQTGLTSWSIITVLLCFITLLLQLPYSCVSCLLPQPPTLGWLTVLHSAGNTGTELSSANAGMFITSDAGNSWRQVRRHLPRHNAVLSDTRWWWLRQKKKRKKTCVVLQISPCRRRSSTRSTTSGSWTTAGPCWPSCIQRRPFDTCGR